MPSANVAALAAPLPWRRSVLWLLFLGPFFFLSYGYSNRLAAERAVTDTLFFAWERHIPFLPWTIVPYWSIDLLYGFSFLCCRDDREVDRHALRLFTVQVVSVACFLAFPLRFAFQRPAADGLFGALFDALTSFDQPYNQAPSLHIGLLVLIWAKFAGLRPALGVRALIHGWAVLIGLSVLTTWQHHFVDLPTGAAIGLLSLWLWPDGDRVSPAVRERPVTVARLRLASFYALASVLAAGVALTLGGAGLWLGWLALALGLVAGNYAWSGAAGFQKEQGRHSLAAALLLLPYTLAAWLNARWWTLARPQPDLIADDVWLGRLPTAAAMTAGGFAALCDVTAELPAPRGPWRYAGLPWLDLVPPGSEQLLAAARQIEALRGQGPVLVACALGYSRSAAAVAAWLRLSGRADSMASALDILRRQRSTVVLGSAHLAALAEFEALLAKEASRG